MAILTKKLNYKHFQKNLYYRMICENFLAKIVFGETPLLTLTI